MLPICAKQRASYKVSCFFDLAPGFVRYHCASVGALLVGFISSSLTKLSMEEFKLCCCGNCDNALSAKHFPSLPLGLPPKQKQKKKELSVSA